MNIKRYAVCGVSSRAIDMYIGPILRDFPRAAQLVALLDIDPMRFSYCRKLHPETGGLPCYNEREFDKMVDETHPDAILVVCMDCHHVDYILAGLRRGLDVISEKPMTTNTEDALKVVEAEKASKGKVVCTFNYRYNPVHRKVRELVLEGKVGRVTHVDLTWYVDIRHGSSYFNRWNRMRENSGSLSIHKASHHFDLVNWWIDGIPEKVHAFGALNHYGPNAPFKPEGDVDGNLCSQCPQFLKCAYNMRWATRNSHLRTQDDHLQLLQGRFSEMFTTYRPEMCIFDKAINIYDTFIANVKYRNGALLNYSCNFSTPYEGYRLAINGTHGRIETMEYGGEAGVPLPNLNGPDGDQFIDCFPIFGGRERISVPAGVGGHGGGDPLLREDVFLGEDPDRKYDILAKSVDGLRAIAIGDAVYRCIHDESGERDLRPFMQ